jgi:hypothetical protein
VNVRAICEGEFTLPLPIAEALFTPEGERSWAGASWDPVYAIPDAVRDDFAPGTVFTTESAGGRATWIVLERSDDGLRRNERRQPCCLARRPALYALLRLPFS